MTLLIEHAIFEPFAIINRERLLPRPGEVLKRPGQSVSAQDVVARARVPQNHHIIDVARELGVSAEQVSRYILKQPGETVEANEPIAARRRIAGLRRFMARSPIEGEVVEVGDGIVILEGEPTIIEVKASVPGKIVDSLAPWGVVVESEGARLHLAWGHGDQGYNELKIVAADEDGDPIPEALDDMEHRGAIVAVTTRLTEPFLRAASRVRVGGLLGANMRAELVPLVEELDLSVGLTEGFGPIPMPRAVAELLRSNAGRQVTLDSGQVGRWRVSRPEFIISLPGDGLQAGNPAHGEPLQVGHRVRILRGPQRGAIGQVSGLTEGARPLPSGLWLAGAEVELDDGELAFVPFANLEHLG